MLTLCPSRMQKLLELSCLNTTNQSLYSYFGSQRLLRRQKRAVLGHIVVRHLGIVRA
jgi:hypothetical protein